LISLKAGGTGLNLTAAEAVIHYDPWWNVSAENQATDRAYRIGQNNNVQVFKLIMKDSVEERMTELQKKKKELSDLFVENNEGSLSKMTTEDLMKLFEL
jgi:SNF2 family DNA or RNA helicase